MLTTTLTTFAERTSCRVVMPDDPGYDAARQAFNTALDLRPAAVAYPRDAADVAAAAAAREHGRASPRRPPGTTSVPTAT